MSPLAPFVQGFIILTAVLVLMALVDGWINREERK